MRSEVLGDWLDIRFVQLSGDRRHQTHGPAGSLAIAPGPQLTFEISCWLAGEGGEVLAHTHTRRAMALDTRGNIVRPTAMFRELGASIGWVIRLSFACLRAFCGKLTVIGGHRASLVRRQCTSNRLHDRILARAAGEGVELRLEIGRAEPGKAGKAGGRIAFAMRAMAATTGRDVLAEALIRYIAWTCLYPRRDR